MLLNLSREVLYIVDIDVVVLKDDNDVNNMGTYCFKMYARSFGGPIDYSFSFFRKS